MPLYLLHGDSQSTDAHGIRERLDVLLKGIPREGNLNFTTYDLADSGTSFMEIVSSTLTIPFLGGKRVVVAKNAKVIDKSFRKPEPDPESGAEEDVEENIPKSQESLLRAVEQLKSLPDNALLILVEEDGHLDGRTSFYRALKDAGCDIETFKQMWFDPASGNIRDAVDFIQHEASVLGIRPDHKVAQTFAYRVGPNRSNIVNELKKLAAYVGPGNSPSIEDVEAVVTECYEAGIFSMVDYLGQGNTAMALKELDDLMDRGAAAPYILTMIVRQIRLIALVREVLPRPEFSRLDWKEQPKAIGSELGEHPFVITKVLKQERTFKQFRYSQITELFMETDVHIKRGTMPSKPPGKLALEMLITKLASGHSGSTQYEN